MLAYPITLEDDDGTLLATSPAGPSVSQPVAFRKGRFSARQALLRSTSAENPETVILLRPVGRREHLHDRP